MIRFPWQKWVKPPPPADPQGLAHSMEMLRETERRRLMVMQVLAGRRAVVVTNHIARDVRNAMKGRG